MKKIKYPFTLKEFQTIYSKVPRLCIELIIRDRRGVLLTLRKAGGWNGWWHLPGGTLYYGESIHRCIKRIAEDELGIKVRINKFVGYSEYPNKQKKQGFGTPVGLFFLCRPGTGKLRGSDQAEKINFLKKLPPNVVPEHRILLGKKLKIK